MSRARTFALFVPVVVAMVIVDRLTKLCAEANLVQYAHEMNLGVVDFTLVHNRGAAFGMGQGQGSFFIILAVIICIAIIAWLFFSKGHDAWEVVGLALVVAGGIGNCIDRLTTHYVVDFINFTFIDFPVFNVADICVTCGVAIFLIAFAVREFVLAKSSEKE